MGSSRLGSMGLGIGQSFTPHSGVGLGMFHVFVMESGMKGHSYLGMAEMTEAHSTRQAF